MKVLLFIMMLLFSVELFAQSKLDSTLSSTTCKCLVETKNYNEETFSDCIFKAFQSNSALIVEESFKVYGDTSETSARKLGMDTYRRLSVSMISTCDVYYKIFDTLRNYSYTNINLDSAKQNLKSLLSLAQQKPTEEIYTLKGIIDFKELHFDEAIKNFNQAISLNPSAFQSIFFKAWSLEKIHRFDESISLYKSLASSTGRYDFNIFAALAERKKNGL